MAKKYIDADRLKAEINNRKKSLRAGICGEAFTRKQKKEMLVASEELDRFNRIIDSLQQDETQVDKMLCSQIWWEEQGWIMIPPNATVEGVDSLLRQVRKKLQQEQPEVDLEKEIDVCWQNWLSPLNQNEVEGVLPKTEFAIYARHFYGLGGINARKEGSK